MGCIALVRCVLVLRCGSAGVVWYHYAGWSTSVLTFETCWALNNDIIKQVTSSWSIFTQLFRINFFISDPETRGKEKPRTTSLLSSNYTFLPTLSPVTCMSNISIIMIALISPNSRFFFLYSKFHYKVQGASNCSYTMTGWIHHTSQHPTFSTFILNIFPSICTYVFHRSLQWKYYPEYYINSISQIKTLKQQNYEVQQTFLSVSKFGKDENFPFRTEVGT